MFKKIARFLREEEATTTVEYAVMLMLIIAVCIVSIQLVGSNAQAIWGENNGQIQNVLGDL